MSADSTGETATATGAKPGRRWQWDRRALTGGLVGGLLAALGTALVWVIVWKVRH